MMELLKDYYPSEVEEIGSSPMESIQKAMESQKRLFHTQIDSLRTIVVTQCKLTGVNPLSQEMAAGALSIKIGKRPRDLLNPKAVRYMQSVFSIKDAISKKESREISALFGLTVTQVREYFASQRTRVRKMVRLSREKAIRASTNKDVQDGVSTVSDPMLPLDPIPLSSVGPSHAEDAPSCSNQDEFLPGLGDCERKFMENIFSSMCKEETFSGQVKLMQWILQIENPSILCWFQTKGGLMILATWLSQAASEEQTSVVSVALKVLFHLPLHKALPAHMSAILQGVNRLRFYRISDISNRARLLLSKWSKMLSKSQALRKPNGIKSAGLPDIDLSQRIGELIGDNSWQSCGDIPGENLVVSCADPDDTRKMETQQVVKLLTASSDELNKKHILGTSSTHNKERRKVLLVEQPRQKAAGKSQQQVKTLPAGQARPITADEIQKAKMRARFIQNSKTKSEGPKRPSLLSNDLLSASEAYLRPKLEAQKKARLLPTKSSKQVDFPSDQKPTFDQKESLLGLCRRVQIPWRAPPGIQVNADWEVGTGQNSKEIDVQRKRMLREKETIYRTLQEVPPNPKEPWDLEMDYDDTLTPMIPIEQSPEPSELDGHDVSSSENHNPLVSLADPPSTSAQPEPDLELLAVLLKNPELVFALTSGQASGLSSEDTVKLLDMLKSSSSSGGAGLLNKPLEVDKKVEVSLPSPTPTPTRNVDVEVSLPSPTPPTRFVEVSLPSPTPSSNPGPSGWISQASAKNPFSRHTGVAAAVVTASDRLHNTSTTVQSHQFPSAALIPPSSHHHVPCQTPPISNQQTFFPPPLNQDPPMEGRSVNPTINSDQIIPSHSPSMPAHSQPYSVPEDESNNSRAMLKPSSRHGLTIAHNNSNSFSTTTTTHGNHHQNVYNPVPVVRGRGGPWERRPPDVYYGGGGRKGFESWSLEENGSPAARYPPPEHLHGGHGHGHGWSYQEQQRGYGGHGYGYGPPPDRITRHQNSSVVFRDHHHNWRGGGGGNQRWHDGDRRQR